jgi:hypothetical protein
MLQDLESETDQESSPILKQRKLEKSHPRRQESPGEDFEPSPVSRARSSSSSERENALRVAQRKAAAVFKWFSCISWSDTLGPGENKEF